MNTSKAKRTILVLDRFTHGHDAALHFIRRQGWKTKECDIEFCGSHTALLRKLAERKAYAVVPVYNSTKGEVKSVTDEIKLLHAFGYQFDEVDALSMRIHHHLLVPKHVKSIDQLQHVISKEEALGQCDGWLKAHGITPEKRGAKDSTGAAAKCIALLQEHPNTMIGAIAPRSAARHYKKDGLRILAEKVEDNKKNTTDFLLLENRMVIEHCIVGIVGINGRYGTVLREFFESLGMIVIGSDRKIPTKLSNIDVVRRADVVIFALTVHRTVAAIREVLKYTRKGQLLMDITSVKQPAVREMKKGKAQVVGLHPMHAPSVPFDGQTMIVCPARLTDPRWKTWVVNFLAATGTKRKWSTAKAHDEYMVTVQVAPQSANMINAMVITEMGVDVSESRSFTSPFYKLMFCQMGRFLGQDPEMFFSIFTQNPLTVPMLKRRHKLEGEFIKIVEGKDVKKFVSWFVKARKHFGPDGIREANELFLRLSTSAKTVDGNNAVTLEFHARDNKLGLGVKLLGIFERNGVNVTAISSVSLNPNRHQISLTTEEAKTSENVRQALETIERLKEPKITVIA